MRAPIAFKLAVLFSIVLLGILLTADAWAVPTLLSSRAHGKEVAENLHSQGYAMHHGRQVDRIAGIQELYQ